MSVSIAAGPEGASSLAGTLASGEGQGAGCETALAGGALQLTDGERARILSDGSAAAPADTPAAVRLAIAAGNLIHTKPYPEPDVHYGSLAAPWPAYDCSGAVSFVLYGAGLLGADALHSTGLESYEEPGPGRWITVYANPAHAWIVVAGIALDTSAYGGASVPTGSGPLWRSDPSVNLGDGLTYVVRHPRGL